MSILQGSTATSCDHDSADDAAIIDLRTAFIEQQLAFDAERNPTLQARRSRLEALILMMLKYRERIAEALNMDFGAHPAPASDLIEMLGVVGRATYALEHLEAWMQPSQRDVDVAMFGSSKAFVRYQPKGVVGNIAPWNFPFDLSVGPMIEMLAAGNRVMLKPSEFAPACAALLREMVAETFDPTLVHVSNGGSELARAFAAMRWNHLLYTGSPNVGRQVMEAAARNLTPVTLELGGKCPTIMTPGSVTAAHVESIIGTKTIKNGQMCISVDYCFVPRGEVQTFIDLAMSFMQSAAPAYSRSSECTGIISERHLERLRSLLQEARGRGSRIVTLESDGGDVDLVTRRMPLSLVVDPPPSLRIMQEEIFGPILPIVPYDDIREAIGTVNAGERPLGLYVFGDDEAMIERVLGATHSGGVTVNACAVQGALPSLGFGGVGMSGMGRHHGVDGFREFSNPRGIVIRGDGDRIAAFYAPHSKAAALVQAALAGSKST